MTRTNSRGVAICRFAILILLLPASYSTLARTSSIEPSVGNHELVPYFFSPIRFFDDLEHYEKALKWGSSGEAYTQEVPITAWGERSQAARYGAVAVSGVLLTYVIEPSNNAFTLTLDANANGDLTDDQSLEMDPVVLSPHPAFAVIINRDVIKPNVLFRLTYVPAMNKVFKHDTTIRRGTLEVHGQAYQMAIMGKGGSYDLPSSKLFLDANRDGHVDIHNLRSDEAFPITTPYVHLDGIDFVFSVTTSGESIRFLEVYGPIQDRPSLAPGSPAPDFKFVDAAGTFGTLSQHKGRVLLVYFWTTWCGPCRQSVPKLRELYSRWSDQGFEIVGVNPESEALDLILQYSATMNIPWKQVVPLDPSAVKDLYRVLSYPTYVLLDAEGTILEAGEVNEIEIACAQLLQGQSPQE